MPKRDKRILTKTQQETLDAIRSHYRTYKVSPTLDELKRELGIGSVQTVADRITALVKKGFVRRRQQSWRNLELTEHEFRTERSLTTQVPLVGSVGADNMSVFAQEDYGQYVHIDTALLNGHRDVIAIRVIGHSMRDADIFDGSYVLVEVFDGYHPRNGDLVAAIINDTAVVKRYYEGPRTIELRPESQDPSHQPIVLTRGIGAVRIIGRVVNVLHANESDANDDVQFIPDPE